jgi:hypothetical protein
MGLFGNLFKSVSNIVTSPLKIVQHTILPQPQPQPRPQHLAVQQNQQNQQQQPMYFPQPPPTSVLPGIPNTTLFLGVGALITVLVITK